MKIDLVCQNGQHRVKLWEDCDFEKVMIPSLVMACQQEMQETLQAKFVVETKAEFEMCKLFSVKNENPAHED